jgi:hypothetical protein
MIAIHWLLLVLGVLSAIVQAQDTSERLDVTAILPTDLLLYTDMKHRFLLNNPSLTAQELYHWMTREPDLFRHIVESSDPILYLLIPKVILKSMRVKNYAMLRKIFGAPEIFSMSPRSADPLKFIMGPSDLSLLIDEAFNIYGNEFVKDSKAGRLLIGASLRPFEAMSQSSIEYA